jgi:hypothetical protein
METIVESKKEIGIIIDKPVTIRDVLRETLNTSYNGHNEGCLNCASINELVDHFIQGGSFKIYRVKENCEDSRGRWIDYMEHGYFMRKEFAEEKVKKLKDEEEKLKKQSFRHNFDIEELNVKI